MIKKILLNPLFVFLSIVLGSLVGFFSPTLSSFLSPLGLLYFSLVKMSLIPLIMTALISSLGNFLHTEGIFYHKIGRILILIVGCFLFFGVVGISTSYFGKTGDLNEKSRAELGKFLAVKEDVNTYFETEKKPEHDNTKSAYSLVASMIPSNIFQALVNEELVKIIVFSILLGISLGVLRDPWKVNLLHDLTGLCDAFNRIVIWTIQLLPFGLFCFFSGHVVAEYLGPFLARGRFLVIFYGVSFILIFLNLAIIAYMTKNSLKVTYHALKHALLVSMSSQYVAIPFAIKGLHEHLNIRKHTAQVLVPLGFTLCPFGGVFAYSFTCVFFLQLYGISLTIGLVVAIFLTSLFAAWASSNILNMFVSLGFLAIIFEPLGISMNAIIVLFLPIAIFVIPVKMILNVSVNCMIFSIIERKNWVKSMEHL
ncbi:MAG: cation:dicarboxylase symporter family transporter [Chlamydiota bacterium]